MRRGIVLLLLLSLMFVGGCGKKAAPSETGSIRVTVEDEHGDAIRGVTLTLIDSEGKKTVASSDSKGNATFSDLAGGDYELEGTADGYDADSTSLSVESGEQETTLTLTSVTASEEDGSNTEETTISGILENVTSYRWKWSSMEEDKTDPSVAEGAFEKPDREYFRIGSGDDLNEIYKVGTTVKMRSGIEGEWNTFTGDAAEGMMGMTSIYTSMFDQNYASLSEEDGGFKRSDGGTVNGYSTQKYVYEISVNNIVSGTTAWVIDSGEFKGGTTRWETRSTSNGKTTSFTWDVFDLNKPIGIELP